VLQVARRIYTRRSSRMVEDGWYGLYTVLPVDKRMTTGIIQSLITSYIMIS